MGDFDYLLVLLSIVYGIALTQLLAGLGKLVRARAHARIYWPSLVWAVTLLAIIVQGWWWTFSLRTVPLWHFGSFLMVLVQPALMSLLATLVLPDVDFDGSIDLRTRFFDQRQWFFGLGMLVPLTSIANAIVLLGRIPRAGDLLALLVFFIVALTGFLFRSETVHKVLAPLAAILTIAYISVFFVRLG